jgi:hypothetical protein|tara:strand:- start:157 stop:534 length:378 start_codon:yes stop_codon:yes gene_type:complete
MAEKIFFDAQSLQPELKIMAGSFTMNGTSDPTTTTGTGFTVTRTGVGKWLVTFGDSYPGILSVMCSFELDSEAPSNITLNTSSAGTSSFIVHDVDMEQLGSTLQVDLTGPIVHFVVFMRNTSLTN